MALRQLTVPFPILSQAVDVTQHTAAALGARQAGTWGQSGWSDLCERHHAAESNDSTTVSQLFTSPERTKSAQAIRSQARSALDRSCVALRRTVRCMRPTRQQRADAGLRSTITYGLTRTGIEVVSMGLDPKAHQGLFGESFVRVLASAAGLIVSRADLDVDGCDFTISHKGSSGATRHPKIDIQVKSWSRRRAVRRDGHWKYRMQAKHFNELAGTDFALPRFLVTIPVNVPEANLLTVMLPDGPSGSTPLHEGYPAAKGVHDLFLAAATSAVSSERPTVLPSQKPAQAKGFLDQVRAGPDPQRQLRAAGGDAAAAVRLIRAAGVLPRGAAAPLPGDERCPQRRRPQQQRRPHPIRRASRRRRLREPVRGAGGYRGGSAKVLSTSNSPGLRRRRCSLPPRRCNSTGR